MVAILHFLTLVIVTMFAASAAVTLNWFSLHATFQMMRPATANRSQATNQLVARTLPSATVVRAK